MSMRKIVLVSACIGIGGLALLAAPLVGFAHIHGHVFVGPGWWGPWWGGPWGGPWSGYPAYSYPAPVPAPCHTAWVGGHWGTTARTDPSGFTTYRRVWVQGHWERVCP